MPIKILHQHKPEALFGLWTMLVEGKNEKKKKWGRAAAPKQFVWEKEGKSKKQGEAQRRPEPARYDSLSSIVFHHDHDPTSA